jgi:hypothetical protein
VAGHRLEILPAEPQRLAQIGKPDAADDRRSSGILRGLTSGVTLPGYDAAMFVVSLAATKSSAAVEAQWHDCGNDHDQTRKQETRTGHAAN